MKGEAQAKFNFLVKKEMRCEGKPHPKFLDKLKDTPEYAKTLLSEEVKAATGKVSSPRAAAMRICVQPPEATVS